MEIVEDVKDTAEMAVDVATMPTFLGGIGGIVVGATLGGLIASNIAFSGTITNALAASGEFLFGAALYGMGLSGRVSHPALRSATQVSGVVVAGMGLGRLLSIFGAPTFGLGADTIDPTTLGDDYGRMVGQDYEGRALGQWSGAAEDEGEEAGQVMQRGSKVFVDTDVYGEWVNENVIGQGFVGQVLGQDAEDDDHAYSPLSFSPMITEDSAPKWAKGASGVMNPWEAAEAWDIMAPSSPMGGVPQWWGSAEGVSHSAQNTTLGNMVVGSEGVGSVIGQ
jgi:hypothetical protein